MRQWPPPVAACLATPPHIAGGFRAPQRNARRWIGLFAAMGAPIAALAVSRAGPALPGVAELALHIGGVPTLGLLVVAALGLLAWQLARLCATDAPALAAAQAGLLPALLPAVLLPGAGIGVLLVPAALALLAGRRDRANHVVALLVHCTALPLLAAPAHSLASDLFGSATILTATWLSLRLSAARAANDNPRMEQIETNWRLPARLTYDKAGRDSQPGKWGVS